MDYLEKKVTTNLEQANIPDTIFNSLGLSNPVIKQINDPIFMELVPYRCRGCKKGYFWKAVCLKTLFIFVVLYLVLKKCIIFHVYSAFDI